MPKTSETPFHAEYLPESNSLMILAEAVGAQVFMMGEVAQIGDGDKAKGKERLVKAFNFLFNHGRLPDRKPTPEQIKNIFTVRVMKDGDQVMFADPLEVRKFGGLDAGFIFDVEKIKEFGQGNYETGAKRIQAYLEYVYERDGSIANAGVVKDSETSTPLATLDPGRSEEDVYQFEEKDRELSQKILNKVLSQVEAWEKTNAEKNATDGKKTSHYEGGFI